MYLKPVKVLKQATPLSSATAWERDEVTMVLMRQGFSGSVPRARFWVMR